MSACSSPGAVAGSVHSDSCRRIEDDRHAVVQCAHRAGGGGRDDRAGAQRLDLARSALRPPRRPQAGERERLAARARDPVRHAAGPLVEAVGDDQAAAALERVAVGGPLGDRLGAGVDRLGGDLGRVRQPRTARAPSAGRCPRPRRRPPRGGSRPARRRPARR